MTFFCKQPLAQKKPRNRSTSKFLLYLYSADFSEIWNEILQVSSEPIGDSKKNEKKNSFCKGKNCKCVKFGEDLSCGSGTKAD